MFYGLTFGLYITYDNKVNILICSSVFFFTANLPVCSTFKSSVFRKRWRNHPKIGISTTSFSLDLVPCIFILTSHLLIIYDENKSKSQSNPLIINQATKNFYNKIFIGFLNRFVPIVPAQLGYKRWIFPASICVFTLVYEQKTTITSRYHIRIIRSKLKIYYFYEKLGTGTIYSLLEL